MRRMGPPAAPALVWRCWVGSMASQSPPENFRWRVRTVEGSKRAAAVGLGSSARVDSASIKIRAVIDRQRRDFIDSSVGGCRGAARQRQLVQRLSGRFSVLVTVTLREFQRPKDLAIGRPTITASQILRKLRMMVKRRRTRVQGFSAISPKRAAWAAGPAARNGALAPW